MLDEEIDSFKTLTALLLSSMKSFVTFRKEGQKGADEAQENRNYYVQAMVDCIDEIVRILELFEAHDDLIGEVVICYYFVQLFSTIVIVSNIYILFIVMPYYCWDSIAL